VEQNFTELNYNAHFKGPKKGARPIVGQDCIRTTRLHGVTNQTSTKKNLQKSKNLKSHTKNSVSEIPRAVLLLTQVFWEVWPCPWASSSLRFERSLCLHIQVQAGHQFLRPLETSQTIRLTTRRHIPEGFNRHLSSASQKPILNHVHPNRTLTSYKQPTRCDRLVEFIIPMFLNCLTCSERHTAHHQELKNFNCSL
jgi:hypothetical protein